MPRPQNKRLMIARFGAFARTVEVYTGAGRKRLENAKPIVFGDGNSKVEYLHDPAVGSDPVTLRYITTREDPFIREAETAFERHRLDPESAEAVILLAYTDAGAIADSKSMPRCVIQSVTWPDGDVGTSNESTCEIIVQPSAAFS